MILAILDEVEDMVDVKVENYDTNLHKLGKGKMGLKA
jgi:hypothetical protein